MQRINAGLVCLLCNRAAVLLLLFCAKIAIFVGKHSIMSFCFSVACKNYL